MEVMAVKLQMMDVQHSSRFLTLTNNTGLNDAQLARADIRDQGHLLK